jgi:DNA invertase Pin-like site-specific DNA recombinase
MGITGIYVRTSVDTDGTSIAQQKKEGIKFCKKNKFEYQVYEDEGKSGFKIGDDENPFKNRQGLTKLISDIEKKIIDKVWVYEHSRFSRNQYGSIILFRIFNKHGIIVYEKDRRFDLNDPQTQMISGILDSISQYERHLIVGRTTRGLHDSINRGIRGYREFYGYKKDGKNDDGYVKWVPVKSEIENIKYSYKRILEGSTVKVLLLELYQNKKITESERSVLTKKWTRILRHFEYTGYSLNTDGLRIFNSYKKCEIESLGELNNKIYYVNSVTYPEKLVSLEDWIKVVEKLQVHKIIYKEKMRRTDTESLTGIIKCPYCDSRYYLYSQHYKSQDKEYNYRYYKHTFYGKGTCKNTKSLDIEKTNEIFEIFFFYFYLVYDDTKSLIEESQRILKINLMEIKEKIQNIETENRKIKRQIDRFEAIYEKSEDGELLKLTLKKEAKLNLKFGTNENIISKLKIELEELDKKYNSDELELTYYNVKETIINFFEKMTVEEQRSALIRIIKDCQLFGKYIVIDTGKILFIFNIDDEVYLTTETYNEFKNDKKFKDNFLHSSELSDGSGEISLEVTKHFVEFFQNIDKENHVYKNKVNIKDAWNKVNNFLDVRRLGDIKIRSYNLESNDKIDTKFMMKSKMNKLGIKYDLINIEKIISFTSLLE